MPFKWKDRQRVMVRTDESLIYGKHNRYVPALFRSYKGNGKCEVSIGGDKVTVKLRLIKAEGIDLDDVRSRVKSLEKRLKDMRFHRVHRIVRKGKWECTTWEIGRSHRECVCVRLHFDGRHVAQVIHKGQCVAAPSRFDDEQGMLKAISFEATRQRDKIDPKVQRHF